MSLTSKRSHRLARITLAVVIAGTLVVGCKLNASGPRILRIQRIDIAPGRISLLPAQAADLTISVVTNGGDSKDAESVQGSLHWSTTGGVVNNGGLVGGVRHVTYTSPAVPGTYLFIVTTTNETPADTASIAVALMPVPVHAVTIAPGNLSLALADTTRLSAMLWDSTGSALFGRAIEWSTSDPGVATILAGGFVRAIAAGTTTISATSEGRTGTSVVTVIP